MGGRDSPDPGEVARGLFQVTTARAPIARTGHQGNVAACGSPAGILSVMSAIPRFGGAPRCATE